MAGYAQNSESSSDISSVREFVEGAQARRHKAEKDAASAVVVGVLSAVLFSRKKRR